MILEGRNEAVLTVCDHGIGILYDVGISGIGLGLAIVKQAVELHRGSIHLESEAGKGTEIKVTLPL